MGCIPEDVNELAPRPFISCNLVKNQDGAFARAGDWAVLNENSNSTGKRAENYAARFPNSDFKALG